MFDLFDTTGFVPRRQCGGAWTDGLVLVHNLGDAAIWLAYMAIPLVLVYISQRRRDVPFRGIFWLFVVFILSCGFTHLVEVFLFYTPVYRLAGGVKLLTATASWATVVAFVPLVPRALSLRSPAQLDVVVAERTAELRQLNESLERRVAERTQALEERAARLSASEAALRASLAEKEVLLREIHHRVKNNLQVVSSLLHLQSQFCPDAGAVEMFKDSMNRVRSMALVHERLYRTGDLARVELADYIEGLANHLIRAYRVDADRVSLEVDASAVRLPIDAAVPCGLLVNELVSNCLKHAFAGRDRGRVRVSLAPADGKAWLVVADDGVGLPDGVEPGAPVSFGMQLVAALTEQLGGQFDIGRAPQGGTVVCVAFPLIEAP